MTTPILKVRIDTAQISRLASVVEKAVKDAAEKAVRSNKRIIASMNADLAKTLTIQRQQLAKQTVISREMQASTRAIRTTNTLLRQSVAAMSRLAKTTKDTRTRLVAVSKVSNSIKLTARQLRREQDKIASSIRRTQKFLKSNLRVRKQNARAAKDTAQATRNQSSSLGKMPSALGTIKGLFDKVFSVASKIGRVLAIISGVTLIGILFAMKKWLLGGIALNAEFQAMEVGVAATLAANTKILDVNKKQLTGVQAVIAAQGISLAAQNKLVAAAFRSGQSLQEFVQAFRIALPLITKVGGSVEDTIDLVKRLSLAAAAIGIPMSLVRIQIDDLAKGVVTTRTLLAQVLGITQEQLRLEKERGNLIGFLKERTQAFLDAQTLLESKFNIQIGKLKLISELASLEVTKDSFRVILDIITAITSRVAEINDFTGKFKFNDKFQSFLDQISVFVTLMTKAFFKFLAFLPRIITFAVNALTNLLLRLAPEQFVDPALKKVPGVRRVKDIDRPIRGPRGIILGFEERPSTAFEDEVDKIKEEFRVFSATLAEGSRLIQDALTPLLAKGGLFAEKITGEITEEVLPRTLAQLSEQQKITSKSLKLISDFNEAVGKFVAERKVGRIAAREAVAPQFLAKLSPEALEFIQEDLGLTPGQQIEKLLTLVGDQTKTLTKIVTVSQERQALLKQALAELDLAIKSTEPAVKARALGVFEATRREALFPGSAELKGSLRVRRSAEELQSTLLEVRGLVSAFQLEEAPLAGLIEARPKPVAPSPADIRKRQKEIDLVARAIDAETKANLRLILAQNKVSEGNRVLTAVQQGAARTVVNNLEAEINLKNILFDLDTVRALEDIKSVKRRGAFVKARQGEQEALEEALRLQARLKNILQETADIQKARADAERERIKLLTRSIDIEKSLRDRRARLAVADEIKLAERLFDINTTFLAKRVKEGLITQKEAAQELFKLQEELIISVEEIRTKRAKNFIRVLDTQIRASARRMAEGFGRAFDALLTRGKNAFEKFSSFLRSLFLGIGRSIVENLLQGLFENLLARLREKFKGKGVISQILRAIFGITIPKITAREMQIVNDIQAKKLVVDEIVQKTQLPPIFGERGRGTVFSLASLFSPASAAKEQAFLATNFKKILVKLDTIISVLQEISGSLSPLGQATGQAFTDFFTQAIGGQGRRGFGFDTSFIQGVSTGVSDGVEASSATGGAGGGGIFGSLGDIFSKERFKELGTLGRVAVGITGVVTAIRGLKEGGVTGFGKTVGGGALAGFAIGGPTGAAIGAIIGGVTFGLKALFTRGETAEERAEKIKEAAERNLFIPPDPFAFERANLPGLPSVAGTSLGNLISIPATSQNFSSPEFVNINLTLDGRIISNSLVKLGSGGDQIRRLHTLDAN